MRVLLLSPYPELISAPIATTGDEIAASIDKDFDLSADLIVSFGYRHILKPATLAAIKRPVVNVHISMLPWNRGADPNFWSWFDATPKGVSIHHIDAGIDTGPLLAQREVVMDASAHTLATSYEILRATAIDLFAETWPRIRNGEIESVAQAGNGSYHRAADKGPWFSRLEMGWRTPAEIVEEMGAEVAASRGFWALHAKEIGATPSAA